LQGRLLFSVILGFELRASVLANRCLTTWATLPALFLFSYFSEWLSCLFKGWPGSLSYLHLPRIWDDRCVPPLSSFDWSRWGLQNFLPGLALNLYSPDHCLWVAGVTGVSHLPSQAVVLRNFLKFLFR
jgi:hypothetical protein